MDSKHTPGPWTLNEHEHEPCELIGNGTIHIADIYMTDFPAGKADSLLIAAAPELLEALKGIESTYVFLDSMTAGMEPQHTNTVEALLKIRAAITKAQGATDATPR